METEVRRGVLELVVDSSQAVVREAGGTKRAAEEELGHQSSKKKKLELKRLFKPPVDDELWKSQKHIHHGDMTWRLYDTCRVHHVSTKDGVDIYMLVEREYLLSRGVLTLMQKDQEDEVLGSILSEQKRNKPDPYTIRIDDLYNNFKIVEQDVKVTASSNSSSQNMAFVSSHSTNSTNEVHTAYGVSTASTQSSTASTQKQVSKAMYVEETPPKAMVAIDGVGFDWSYMAEDEVPTTMAVMSFLDSKEGVHLQRLICPTLVERSLKSLGLKAIDLSLDRVLDNKDCSVESPVVVQEDQGYVDSRCSRHMTRNMSYLLDFKEFNRGYATFGGGANGGRITGKGAIKIDNLDFEDVLMHKKFGLVVTDDYGRYTWVFFLATKDETTGILKKFITKIENLLDKKVKVIRCDNGTEFKNSVMNDFCAMKGTNSNDFADGSPLFDSSPKIFGDAGKKHDEVSDKESGPSNELNSVFENLNTGYPDDSKMPARIEAIRLFLAYASFMGFMVYLMDVKSAFLYGRIKEEVYVYQPLGFEDPDHLDKVYKVVKVLYGLHQALRAWYETLAKYLLGNGFHRGMIDQTLFIKRQKGDISLVQVYVDDIIFSSAKKE
uniref:Putative ribonuclease H-like domain-containing protein n=1 Tax=Tanacetum cinerariifolium TaxID=118510 RepID=A0A6L2LBV8_TANCI|nr:putative ribonuclease H-like domain-containing protein [Tanacetum cinerariifolium]